MSCLEVRAGGGGGLKGFRNTLSLLPAAHSEADCLPVEYFSVKRERMMDSIIEKQGECGGGGFRSSFFPSIYSWCPRISKDAGFTTKFPVPQHYQGQGSIWGVWTHPPLTEISAST
jgi:hypothetical protein